MSPCPTGFELRIQLRMSKTPSPLVHHGHGPHDFALSGEAVSDAGKSPGRCTGMNATTGDDLRGLTWVPVLALDM